MTVETTTVARVPRPNRAELCARLQPRHRAWRYSAFAALAVVVLLVVMRGDGVPPGSIALPVSAWLVVPPMVLIGGIGLTRSRGTNVQLTSASYVTSVSLLLVLPPDRVLLLMAATELAANTLRRRPVIKVTFNVTSTVMHVGCFALALHALARHGGVLGFSGIFVVWVSLLAGDAQQYLHTERFLLSLADPLGRVRQEPPWAVSRLEDYGQQLVVACGLVVTVEAVRADHALWTVAPLMEIVLLMFALSVAYRHHHRLELDAQQEWLQLVRSGEAFDALPALALNILRLCRADGVRLVVGGVTASVGVLDERLTHRLEPATAADPAVRSFRFGGVRRLVWRRSEAYRAGIPGGSPGDYLLLSTSWRPGAGFETRLEERIPNIVSEISLELGRQRDRADLERAATHDALTGLLRPAVFTTRLDEALATWDGATVVLIQVGRLRQINDLFGRDTGDHLLREVAGRLTGALAGAALTCRLGGHLFAAALPVGHRDAAQLRATLLSERLLPDDIDGSARATLTIGVALAPQDGLDAAVLIRRAELGLDLAYVKGEPIGFFEPSVEADATRKLSLVVALRGALERGEVTAVYQPQVSPHDGGIVGVEALARWTDPVLGNVPPDEFIVLAESSGLIQTLTRVILQTALEQCRAWADEGLDIPMSVNLSARSLSDPETVPLVATLLRQTGVPACKLTLEVTETAVMDDPAVAIETLEGLRALGTKVSLDDFGTGHSSLAYLRTLPADELKLDRAFTKDLHDPTALALVRASVEVAHALGLSIVAEGVEDQPTLDVLRCVGVDVAQGYHLCRPGTPEVIRPFLLSRERRAVAA